MAKSGAAGDFYNEAISQSARFDKTNNVLTNELDAPSDRKNFTLSMWFKRCRAGTEEGLAAVSTDGNYVRFEASGAIRVRQFNTTINLITNAVFRDTSAWYHLVVAWDLDNGTQDDRVIIYVNGTRQTLATNSLPANTSTDSNFNQDGQTLHIGSSYSGGVAQYFDGYIADVNFVDGTALAPTSFGETKNGVWIPITPTGLTYGNNGFRLQFDQVGVGTASASTIGADTSGEDRHFTSAGIVASDCNMPDSPENNFATWNPLQSASGLQGAHGTLTDGNLKATTSTGGFYTLGNWYLTSGVWYWEYLYLSKGSNHFFGMYDILSNVGRGWDSYDGGNINAGNTLSGGSLAAGNIIGIIMDLDGGTLKCHVNGTLEATYSFTNNGGGYAPFIGKTSSAGGDVIVLNHGQDGTFVGNKTAQGNTDANGQGNFYYAPSAGLAMCTFNIAEPTIGPNSDTQADDHFNTVLYTGNATSGRSISGVGFGPDFVWAKIRVNTYPHFLANSSVGATKYLSTNSADAEATDSGNFTSLDSDGFTIGANGGINANGSTFVAWNWLANGGTTSSNTEGSITSTVQANTTAGFSIVTYTGNATNDATVGHGLLSAPSFIITKKRGATGSWQVLTNVTSDYEEGDFIDLDGTGAVGNSANVSFAPTSTTWQMQGGQVGNTATTIVAYCFHSVEGYSKIGSYTGNGDTDGVYFYLGFRPAWIMTKVTSAVNQWQIHDNKRNTSNVANKFLIPNATNVENTGTGILIDFLSNGFKYYANGNSFNASGVSYIYMAFAEAPFKYANAR